VSGALVRYEQARKALAECVRVDEAKSIRDKAAALEAYARQRDDKELEAWVAEIKCRAVIRCGELSKQLPKAEREGPRGKFKLPAGGKSKTKQLADAGIHTSEANRYEELAEAAEKNPTRAEQYYADCKASGVAPSLKGLRGALKKDRRQEREEALAEATNKASKELGKQLYGVIYADPPWRFKAYSEETGSDRAADNHYPTLTIDDVAEIEVPAAPHCVLFLWVTVPMLSIGIRLIERWGFEYKSACAWHKTQIGTGYWFRNQLELLLVGTRGHIPAPAMGEQPPQVVTANRGRHSEKPEAFAEMIETMFPNLPKLEMFARRRREGWDAWGNQV